MYRVRNTNDRIKRGIINFIQKENIDQAFEVLETTYNNLDNKSPNLLPKITSPYESFLIIISRLNLLQKI